MSEINTNFHNITKHAGELLTQYFQKNIHFSKVILLNEPDRRNNILRLIIDNPTHGIPRSFILKNTIFEQNVFENYKETETVEEQFSATEEAVRGGILKLVSLIFEKSPEEEESKRIFKSFLLRMRETATLLYLLGLEDKNVLDQKLKTGDIEDLVGLTLLHTAYASHHYDDGLILATNKTLDKKDCPESGLHLFNQVMELKKQIKDALKLPYDFRRSEEERNKEESRIACQWIKYIKASKPLNSKDNSDLSEKQINVVNSIISNVEELKKSGMHTLPESPQSVVKHMPRKMK